MIPAEAALSGDGPRSHPTYLEVHGTSEPNYNCTLSPNYHHIRALKGLISGFFSTVRIGYEVLVSFGVTLVFCNIQSQPGKRRPTKLARRLKPRRACTGVQWSEELSTGL